MINPNDIPPTRANTLRLQDHNGTFAKWSHHTGQVEIDWPYVEEVAKNARHQARGVALILLHARDVSMPKVHAKESVDD